MLVVTAFAGTALAPNRTGDDGADRLVGTAENDRLDERGGNDSITGRGDSDVLIGGSGNDRLQARESGEQDGDRVDCGPGRDAVITDDTTEDIIAFNSEIVRRG
ncbi:hypothetical protein GBA65_11235 [Rubrobacter marinus]|uniref:Alkaline phosphatase n=1 Tax=Rubrobacter marinus TaxID=2653852 RepID=A0A6G8PXP1_9ACTN|nr:hypothetical protein [Rubrobacter marinus]QIN79002.1 hypothetical protein GBA65_11235 [Rubrobacter marinus]